MYFSYQQYVLYQNKKDFDSEGMTTKNIKVNENEGIILLSEDVDKNNIITWDDGQYIYVISAHMNESELIYLAQSVK